MRPKSLTLTARAVIAAADPAAPEKARTFRLVANTGEPMRIWPWERPVVVDMDTIDVSGLPVPALYDHCPDVDFAVGNVVSAAVEGGEFVAAGRFTVDETIPPERNYAKKVLGKADAGYAWQVSIGGDPKSVEEIQAGSSVVVNGRTYAGPVSVARGVVLREISFVVLGGDRRTSAIVSRHQHRHRPTIKGSASMSFEEYVQSLGFDPAAIDETQTANLKIKYAEEYPEDPVAAENVPTDEEVAAMDDAQLDEEVAAAEEDVASETPPTNAAARLVKLKAAKKRRGILARAAQRRAAAGGNPAPSDAAKVAAERLRCGEIATVCAAHGNPDTTEGGRPVNLAAHAAANGWTVAQVKARILDDTRRNRPVGPTAIVKNPLQGEALTSALQATLLVRCGRKGIEQKQFSGQAADRFGLPAWLRAGVNDPNRNRVMEAAHKFGDMSLVDIARECLSASGKEVPRNRSDMIQAAFSGSSLTNVFTTNVNAVLLASYMEAPDTTESWTTTTDVADFKTQERPRVKVGPGLTKLPRGGEADHSSYEDTAETYKIARYARQFQVDEQDIIDDRLGALSDTPARFGAAAARLRPDMVYATLLANAAMADAVALFHATHGNLGTGSAFAAATLKAAIAAFQNLQENGVNLNLVLTHLLLPPTLRFSAAELVSSAEILVKGSTDGERGSRNVIADENIQIVSDSRLENGVTDPATGTAYSGSASTWFAASTMVQTIEVAYLRGTGRAPRVRSGQLDKGQYGMWWDVSMDLGAKALDYKGLRKTTA